MRPLVKPGGVFHWADDSISPPSSVRKSSCPEKGRSSPHQEPGPSCTLVERVEFEEHDLVALDEDFLSYSKGTRGVVVFLFPHALGEVLVEFFGDEGETLGVESVPLALLRALSEREG